MAERIAVVTGASSGLGKVTALELAKQGMRVILVCRNQEKGEGALREIQNLSGNPKVSLMLGDLSSQADIRRLAGELLAELDHIDILVNNAGGVNAQRTLTADGIETTFATNHLGYFLLTAMLLDKLHAAPSARVVNVASEAQQQGKIFWEDVSLGQGYSGFKAYMQSKLANIMFTNELARRLAGTKVTANAVHPGMARTDFGRAYRGIMGWLIRAIGPLMRTPEKGAETIVWAATAPELAGANGRYFADKRAIRSQEITHDPQALQRLWELSEKMTGMRTKGK